MKIWDVTFTNEDKEGSAIVSACTANEAAIILQSSGRLNAGRYKVTSVNLIGCNNTNFKQIISENFCEPRIVRPSDDNNNSVVIPDFIDNLTDEDIAKLRGKLNIQNDVLYVDRIGAVDASRTKAYDGYIVFNTHNQFVYGYRQIDSTMMDEDYIVPKDESGNYTAIRGHLYIKRDGKFIDLGIPKYRHIISPTKEATLSDHVFFSYLNGNIPEKNIIEKIESFKPREKGFFIRKYNSSKGPDKGYWKYICPFGKQFSLENNYNAVLDSLETQPISSYKTGIVRITYDRNTNYKHYLLKQVIALGYIKRSRRPCHAGGYRTLMKGSPIEVRKFFMLKSTPIESE